MKNATNAQLAQKALNALLQLAARATDNYQDIHAIGREFGVPYSSSFRVVLLRCLGWIEPDPANENRHRYKGPAAPDIEMAKSYLNAARKYNRKKAEDRAHKQFRENIRAKVTAPGNRVIPEVTHTDDRLFGVQQSPGKLLTLFDSELNPSSGKMLKGLALMEKAQKYGVLDPVAFALDCLADSRI